MANPAMDSIDIVSELDKLIAWIDSIPESSAVASSAVRENNLSQDAAFQPPVPPGHTSYSWNNLDPVPGPQYQLPKKAPEPEPAPPKRKAVEPPQSAPPKKAAPSKKGPPKSDRKNRLLENEATVQELWSKEKAFESNPDDRPKYMCTFPYPYMNGFLHVGHAFTITKAEFAAGYQRLKGKNVLFPFGFHCTGMPIAAAAKKLAEEVERYGNPPVFPIQEETKKEQKKKKKGKKTKGKLAKKKSKAKFQWQIMKEFELNDDQIQHFVEPETWLTHFPPIGREHLEKFGLKADFRRSFITTEVNACYDKFIRWQFETLHDRNKLFFGNRPSVFSIVTKQPCADHDRAQGEQVMPQNYTLIKMRVLPEGTPYTQEKGDSLAPFFEDGRPLYMVAGTLRPETMYGQTNCFVLPTGNYIVVQTAGNELWITGEWAAKNMAWQEMLNPDTPGEITKIGEPIKGWDLLGRKVEAPNSQYDYVYVLPLHTILMDKATGIVTSVPSDAPADFAALNDMKKDEKARKKYYITEEMVEPFQVVEIINIPATEEYPELGNQSAVTLCKARKVKSQKDERKIEEIKEIVYNRGFSFGKMIIGPHTGTPVKHAKDIIKKELIEQGLAADYYEPEETVVARTGDVCIVALTDQWFIKYGEEQWRTAVENHVREMEFYNPKTKTEFERIVSWLTEWACSREFGLGTKLPIDDRYVIESLSDSTIYMAYYTIVHHLQGDCNLDNHRGPINPEDLTKEVFDFIYLGKDLPDSPIGAEKLQQMRDEFLYWYPMDLRVSAKDLIGNHLTMSLYNHVAMWPDEPDKWPRSMWVNGHVMINADKMSKSTGNFFTLAQGIEKFSADGLRFALADAGDTLEDSNFSETVANAAILNLTKEELWMEEQMDNMDYHRSGDYCMLDAAFDNAISQCVIEADKAYAGMKFRDSLRSAWYNLQKARDFWRNNTSHLGLHRALIRRFIETQLVVLCPICPHWCEHMWQKFGFGENGLCVNAAWPEVEGFDFTLHMQFNFLQKIRHSYNAEYYKKEANRKKKMNKEKTELPKFNACRIYVASEYYDYQKMVLETLEKHYDVNNNVCDTAYRKELKAKCSKQDFKKVMDFATMIVKELDDRRETAFSLDTPFDELSTITNNIELITSEISDVPVENIEVWSVNDPNKIDERNSSAKSLPGKPVVVFYLKENTL